jgi:acyl carrier protein
MITQHMSPEAHFTFTEDFPEALQTGLAESQCNGVTGMLRFTGYQELSHNPFARSLTSKLALANDLLWPQSTLLLSTGEANVGAHNFSNQVSPSSVIKEKTEATRLPGQSMRHIQLPMETMSTPMETDCDVLARLLDYASLEVSHGANLQFHDESQVLERPQSKDEPDRAATATHATSQINVPQDNIKIKAKSDVQDVLKMVREVARETTGVEIDTNAPLMSAGLDSLSAVEFTNALGARFSMDLVPTTLYDHPTLESLASFLSSELASNAATEATTHEEKQW